MHSIETYLKSNWQEVMMKYSAPVQLQHEYWNEIQSAYTAPGRHYHNLNHIEYMMEKAGEYQEQIHDIDALKFSVFYHDIVYDTNRNDNEERSAQIARDRLEKLTIPEEKIARCESQILATKSHKRTRDKDTNYLLDFDLAYLGESPSLYREYSANIRKEYAQFPDALFKQGRTKALEHFLKMDRIFKTEEFYNKYEKQARENIRSELKDS
jgi:predicted metal-dependent HD superfamily phosphohydrolase